MFSSDLLFGIFITALTLGIVRLIILFFRPVHPESSNSFSDDGFYLDMQKLKRIREKIIDNKP